MEIIEIKHYKKDKLNLFSINEEDNSFKDKIKKKFANIKIENNKKTNINLCNPNKSCKVYILNKFSYNIILHLFLIFSQLINSNIYATISFKISIIQYSLWKIILRLIIKIDKIYCFNYKLETNISKSEIIFIQDDKKAPIYYLGIIINFNGELIFKGYQMGINEPKTSLSSLSKERIKVDILYFISKINKLLKKQITKFSLGIITTINAYYSNLNNNINVDDEYIDIDDFNIIENSKKEENENEYKNYKIMKNHCYENNF